MQKSVDVATLMQQNFDLSDIQMLYPENINWDEFQVNKPDLIFEDNTIDFLSKLSHSLLKDSESRLYPDVITFAFFCRKANLLKLKAEYSDNSLRLGRGILFHIAPSNVPVNFAYSLVAGLLAGNSCIIRTSTKKFVQVDIIVRHISKVVSNYPILKKKIAIVNYGHESQANAFFSLMCQVRIIWGGDQTIKILRQAELTARAFDVTFADRYSFAVINADMMAIEKNISSIAEGFYNDTYLFDQNACSAPHLVVWLGDPKAKEVAKERFWKALLAEIEKRNYAFQDVMAVDKLVSFYQQAVNMKIKKVDMPNNKLQRILMLTMYSNIDQFRGRCGYFTEFDAHSINEIEPIIKNHYQTIAYYGFSQEKLINFVSSLRPLGIDRIVPIGETTSFSLTWDGYNLINTFSRVVDVK